MRRVRAARYDALIREGLRALAGVHDTMEALHGLRPKAIVTSASRDHSSEIHLQTGLVAPFDFVLADGDYARHKPHPGPYLTADERMGVDPARCLVVEDTERGLGSATNAGMQGVVIPNELTAGADFSCAVAKLESIAALPGWLGLR